MALLSRTSLQIYMLKNVFKNVSKNVFKIFCGLVLSQSKMALLPWLGVDDGESGVIRVWCIFITVAPHWRRWPPVLPAPLRRPTVPVVLVRAGGLPVRRWIEAR